MHLKKKTHFFCNFFPKYQKKFALSKVQCVKFSSISICSPERRNILLLWAQNKRVSFLGSLRQVRTVALNGQTSKNTCFCIYWEAQRNAPTSGVDVHVKLCILRIFSWWQMRIRLEQGAGVASRTGGVSEGVWSLDIYGLRFVPQETISLNSSVKSLNSTVQN